jgi:uncharacterized repeat protein (TIGR04138 family)
MALLRLNCGHEMADETGAVGALYRPGIAADRLGGEDLARGASAARGHGATQTLKMQEINFDQAVELITAKDPRFARDAYVFVREALDFTQKLAGKEARGGVRHVSGQELLDGIRQFALQQFGPMAVTVLEEWGVKSCRDFGEIVFNMVEIGLLAKTERDSREDFQNGYDFTDAFHKPFWPQGKRKTEKKPVAGSKN